MASWGLAAFLAACAGAIVFELVHWYDLRGKLLAGEPSKLFSSWLYWAITFSMIVASGVVAVIWYSDRGNVPPLRDYFFFGAAAPLLLKKIVSAVGEKQPMMGSGQSLSVAEVARMYFR